jgi:PPM family protein phosphatase
MLDIRCAGRSDIGLKRQNNEDALVVEGSLGVLAVADGMGGASSGEVASQIFAETVLEVFANVGPSDKTIGEMVQEVFLFANERILRHAAEEPGRRGMGCTAEVLAVREGNYVLGHVGDSRTYLFRQGVLRQMTKDHSVVQEQLDQGILTPEEARTNAFRNVISRAVGVKDTLPVDLVRGTAQPGDIFLLCSDGLTDMVEEELIRKILSLTVALGAKADQLVREARAAGGYDNITAALCEVS